MTISISNAAYAVLDDASEQDLLGQLGVAVTGAESDFNASIMKLASTKAALGWPHFVQVGIDFFNSWWPRLKPTICQLYQEYSEDNKDWIEQLATAILAVFNVGSAIAILIAKIAVKRGLDQLCAD